MRDKNKNSNGNFLNKKEALTQKKRWFLYAILLLIFVSGGSIVVYNKFKNKKVEQSQVASGETSTFPGWWLKDNFKVSVCEQDNCQENSDPDKDGLTNKQEYYYHSNPINPDTNGNGMNDGEMVAAGFDPSRQGKVSLDHELTDEEIFDESLVFDEDVNKIINEMVDPTKVTLPEVNPTEIKISYVNSKETIIEYLEENNKVIERYFSSDPEALIISALKDNNYGRAEQLKSASALALMDLKKITVPSAAALLHQYYIAMLKVLPSVLTVPDQTVLENELNAEGNFWYDQTQTLSVLMYKIDQENRKLSAEYQ